MVLLTKVNIPLFPRHFCGKWLKRLMTADNKVSPAICRLWETNLYTFLILRRN